MAIYNINGTTLADAYKLDGDALQFAYNKSGEKIFSGVSLVVANYNVGGWYDGSGSNVPAAKAAAYFTMQEDTLDNVNADILCLEEYWTYFSGTTPASDLLSSRYPYVHAENGSSQYYGRCICSKYPITDYEVNIYSNDANRYYDCATIDVNGVPIVVFVTHLSVANDNQYRIDEATELYNYIVTHDIENYIVCGDFNVNMVSPLSQYNLSVFGQFMNAGAELANGGSFGLFQTYSRNSTYTDNLCVDNIIISDGFAVDSVWVDTTKVTFQSVNGDKIDHMPLIATVTF